MFNLKSIIVFAVVCIFSINGAAFAASDNDNKGSSNSGNQAPSSNSNYGSSDNANHGSSNNSSNSPSNNGNHDPLDDVVFGNTNLNPSSDLGIGNPVVSLSIPEPEIYFMLLSGLGLLGFLMYRRKKAN